MELNKEQKDFLDKYTKGKWTLNEETGLVDIEGDFNCSREGLTDFKGVKFGSVIGSFCCDYNNLTSLEGAPQEVGGSFRCSHNRLTSLEGAPQKVEGYFDCSYNMLTSLEGAPQEVGGSFYCSNNMLTSLEGAPQKVEGCFWCDGNKLTSLEGAPQNVGCDFYCSGNKLTSLVGAPQKVEGCFWCDNNSISEKTLGLVWETMQEKKIDYWFALSLLKSQIPNRDWKLLEGELEERLSKDAQTGIYMLERFGHFV